MALVARRRPLALPRWPDGKTLCPHCGSDNVKYLQNARVFKCYEKHPRQKFSLKVGTIFEDSPIGLEKWLPAMWLVVNCIRERKILTGAALACSVLQSDPVAPFRQDTRRYSKRIARELMLLQSSLGGSPKGRAYPFEG